MPHLKMLRGLLWPILALAGLLARDAAGATDLKGRKLDVDPKVVKQAKLEYPELFAYDPDRAFKGNAVINFVVDEKGEVLSPEIRTVSHPAFVPPALDALYATKFSPGMIDGAPVACPYIYVFTFDVRPGFIQGQRVYPSEPFTLPSETPPNCPEQFRYDTAPRPIFVTEPVYPRELLLNKVEGEAQVMFIIDQTGRVAETKIVAAAKPEFGAALRASIETWRFTPPQLEHRPTMTLITRSHKFGVYKTDLAADGESGRVMRLLRSGGEKIMDATALAQMPKVRYRCEPEYPRVWLEKGMPGVAEVEFIIDRRGRVRLPRIVSANQVAFGWAAATAVQQWYYEPPQHEGRAVDVRVVMPFQINPPPPAKKK